MIFLRDLKRVQRSQRTNFQRFNSVDHIVDRARGRGEVENVIYFATFERAVNVELEKLKIPFAAKVLDVRLPASQ